MQLSTEGDADRGGSGQDEKGADQSGNAGTEAHRRTGRRSVPGLRPGHDHTKPGYTPPLSIRQCCRSSCLFPSEIRSRNLIFQDDLVIACLRRPWAALALWPWQFRDLSPVGSGSGRSRFLPALVLVPGPETGGHLPGRMRRCHEGAHNQR
jgi:hypothetical protein